MSKDLKTTAGKIEDLRARLDEAVHAAGETAITKQHAKGKLTARERIALLLDEGSFQEMDEFARHRSYSFGMEKNRPYGDGVVIGFGTIDGRSVAVYSQDFTIFGGSLGEVMAEKIKKIMEFALKNGVPLIGINDSGGARIQEGVQALGGYGHIFRLNTRSSGVIPQISLILGPCAGGAAYSPALTDFTVMVNEKSYMFITGPDVIKTVTGEEVGMEELGGAHTHAAKTGNAHYLADSEEDAIDYVKALLSYLPSNNMDGAPHLPATETLARKATDTALDTLIPDSPNQPYDMKTVIHALLDEGEFLEVHANFAPNIIVGYGRIEGET
ncbi:MAG: methylmalonyl-CoA carboxyltransferase, partial [Actinomycetales bacterium]|nr:methylmalonyl-CoA carboxyltransferase [Actinomycetales bacterium]